MKKKIVALMLTVMVAVTFVPMISFGAEEEPASDVVTETETKTETETEVESADVIDDDAEQEPVSTDNSESINVSGNNDNDTTDDLGISEEPGQGEVEEDEDVEEPESGLELEKYWVYLDINSSEGSDEFGDGYYDQVETLGEDVDAVFSANEEIATVKIGREYYSGDKKCVTITSVGRIGETTVTVVGVSGKTAEIEVKVGASFELSEDTIRFNSFYYDENKRYINSEDYYDIYALSGSIVNVYSEDTSVVKVKAFTEYYEDFDDYEYEYYQASRTCWKVTPVGVGKTNIVCVDEYGQKETITAQVTSNYMKGCIYYYSYVNTARYGTQITGKTLGYATVKMRMSGKTYTVKANKSGYFKFKAPFKKIGTKIKFTITYNGTSYVYNRTLAKPGTTVYIPNITKNSKKIKLTVRKAHKGDTIILKIGKRTYKRKVKSNAAKQAFTFKIKKNKAGKKITVKVVNKFKQKVGGKTSVVYYAYNIKQKMTKKQCRLVPGWEYPDEVYVNGKWTTWWYDDDGDGYADDSYLLFYRGKLRGWYY